MYIHDTLYVDSSPVGYDWLYPWTISKTVSIKKIQSRFIWNSSVTDPTEHSIVAFTQGSQPNKLNAAEHTPRAALWNEGIGAFMMQGVGIGIEVWNMPTAYWWTQTQPTCAGVTLPVISLTEALNTPPASYITSNPNFTIAANTIYWLRLTLTDGLGGYVTVKAELYNNTTLIQMAQMGVIENSWLPDSVANGTIARAGGTATITIDAFDYF